MNRLTVALIAYAVLAIAAYVMLSGVALSVVLIVFGGLIAKTVLWHFKPDD